MKFLWNGHLARLFLLREGSYIKSDISPNFENIQLTQIITALVERAWQVGSVQALEELEAMREI